MSTDLEKLQNAITESIRLVEEVSKTALYESTVAKGSDASSESPSDWSSVHSLLEQLENAYSSYHQDLKRTIRLIHHPACSGGTLIAKCLSALPNVFLLSEVHPHSGMHPVEGQTRFCPTDIAALAKYSGVPFNEDLAERLFNSAIENTYGHVEKIGGTLILRDHAHSDFFLRDSNLSKKSGAVAALLNKKFTIRQLVTIRDPIDSYLSLRNNGWIHFEPPTFDEYCRRMMAFLRSYNEAPILKYEDFVLDSQTAMKRICEILDIPYLKLFESTFDIFRVTGGSGRSGGEAISPRQRRPIEEKLLQEINDSEYYSVLAKTYGYQ